MKERLQDIRERKKNAKQWQEQLIEMYALRDGLKGTDYSLSRHGSGRQSPIENALEHIWSMQEKYAKSIGKLAEDMLYLEKLMYDIDIVQALAIREYYFRCSPMKIVAKTIGCEERNARRILAKGIESLERIQC